MRRAAGIAALAVLVGCGAGGGKVTRVIDGRLVEGRFVAPEAYALFLRGAIAEGSDALPEAIASYEAVARVDDEDPEVFARIARARCARDPRDPKARAALERAFALDADYGPAFAAAAACGDTSAAERAARVEPRDAGAQLAYARKAPAGAARARLLELTLEQPNSGDALDALASWADAHDDLDLLVLALGEAARRVPRLDAVTAKRVLALAGEGQTARARRVAAALLDARGLAERGGAPLDETTRAAVGRLAVDEAAERDDETALRRRAIAARLPITEAAARAALATRFDLAASIARVTLAADPNDAGARMVLAASAEARGDASALRAAFSTPSRSRSAPAAACALLARALLRASSADAARTAMAAVTCDPVARDDSPVVSMWVDFAARGIVPETTLPPEGRIELAFRKREPLGDTPRDLDVRHELLARAHRDPKDARATELATKLARRSPTDPIVLASLLAVARAHDQTLDDLSRAALAPPADPVLDATLLETLPSGAERTRIRARFAALAATPAERALIR
jgi:hypothetical protein